MLCVTESGNVRQPFVALQNKTLVMNDDATKRGLTERLEAFLALTQLLLGPLEFADVAEYADGVPLPVQQHR